ncbi:FLAVONOID 3'-MONOOXYGENASE-RELATED [Salix purpurea]|uniref:FLAVONOID 3'-MONOOXYGENASE-RELATED n=1 Tax=Salix purpurea TaxID=77065 RepID=A0A9Q0TGR0_SALPP|nr:FLAVONOID 3'-MONOOXYGENASE-RELATED [Salix purpurea]
MEEHLGTKQILSYSLLPCVLFLLLSTKFLLQKRKKRNLPPSPFALPIIGHLHLLKLPIHRTLDSLSKKYGPIFSLELGSYLAVVVSSPSLVEECFTKNDIVLANRPRFLGGRNLLNYNNSDMGSTDYGDHWRNLRRISALEIFSTSRLTSLFSIRRDEVNILTRRLYRVSSHGYAKVELRSMFFHLTSNVIMRMVAGKRYYGEDVKETVEARLFREILKEFIGYLAMIQVGDMIPILQWVDFTQDFKKLDRLNKRMDMFLQGLIDEHRHDRERNTMINTFLTLQEQQPEYYTDEIIKGHILVMLLAGTETVATAMEWALANLLNHPRVLKKAKTELDTQVGDHLIEESDFANLQYLRCIISETLRLYPVAPLLAPHVASTDCNIGGYDVPAGTTLFVNAWAIHRDPTLWDDPTSFNPERFESGRVGAYNLIPFGMGRRACPGDGLANRMMTLTLGSLIQFFEWERVGDDKIDMTEKTGISMCKVDPLELMCKARPSLNVLLS